MIIILFIILITIGLALWFWLASRISQVSNTGALLRMFLMRWRRIKEASHPGYALHAKTGLKASVGIRTSKQF